MIYDTVYRRIRLIGIDYVSTPVARRLEAWCEDNLGQKSESYGYGIEPLTGVWNVEHKKLDVITKLYRTVWFTFYNHDDGSLFRMIIPPSLQGSYKKR